MIISLTHNDIFAIHGLPKSEFLSLHALKIAREGQDLYKRVETFVQHLAEMGKFLAKSVEGCNKAIASFERRLLPAVRRFHDMGVATSELVAPEAIDTQPSLPSAMQDDESMTDGD